MIKLILEEDDTLITDFVNDDEFNLLKKIGVTDKDRLISAQKKIRRHLCEKHHKGALFMIEEKDLTEQDKELLKIHKKIEDKETYITY